MTKLVLAFDNGEKIGTIKQHNAVLAGSYLHTMTEAISTMFGKSIEPLCNQLIEEMLRECRRTQPSYADAWFNFLARSKLRQRMA